MNRYVGLKAKILPSPGLIQYNTGRLENIIGKIGVITAEAEGNFLIKLDEISGNLPWVFCKKELEISYEKMSILNFLKE